MRSLQETGSGLSGKIRKGGIFIGSGVAALAIACGGGKGTESKVQKADTPIPPAATDTLKLSPTSPATEDPTPIPIATEITKATVNCEILPPQYCSQGRLVNWTNSLGVEWKLVAFNLEEETPIYAPFDGSLAQTEGPGNLISPNTPALNIYNPDNSGAPMFVLTGDIKLNSKQYTVRKGDIIAYTQNTGKKVFDSTIALTFTAADSTTNSIKTDEDLLRQNFPNLFGE